MKRQRIFLRKVIALFLILLIQGPFVNQTWGYTSITQGTSDIGINASDDVIIRVNYTGDGQGDFHVADYLGTDDTYIAVIAADASNTTLGSTTTTVSGTLGVTGATTLSSTLGVTGISTLNGINNSNDGITSAGAISGVTTLSASSTITASGTITGGNLSTGGTLGVTGATTLSSTLGVTGATTLSSTLGVTGLASLSGGITADNFSVADTTGNLTASGATNVIGTAGSSANTLTGETNTIIGTTSSSLGVTDGASVTATATQVTVLTDDGKGLTVNETTHITTLTGGTNSSTLTLADAAATLGVGTATTSEITVLNATNDGTTTSVTIGGSSNSSNQLLANATTGTNNIEAFTNNIGVATANSENTIGNAETSTNIITGATNAITGVTTVTSTGTANQMIVDATSSRFVSADSTQSVAVNNSGTTITAATGHSLNVTSSTTTIDGSATIYSGNGTGNYLTVGETQTDTIGLNSFDYGTEVSGGMLINGDLGVNGNIYTLDTTANATINVGDSGMTITGATNEVSLQADDDSLDTNARAKLSMAPTSASLLVNTDSGVSHGISIDQERTVISGGTTSTSLTLDDDGATFQNDDTGGPARVMGVANGVNQYDAVNMGQFRSEVDRLDNRIDKAYSGIASVAALAAIPAPVPGKTVSVGLGFGNFENQSAIALGGKALVGKKKNITLTAGVGYCDNTTTISAGVGWSF